MVEVDDLDEGPDARASSDLAVAHVASNAARVARNASNHGVAIGALGSTVVVVAHDHGLVTGVATVEDDHDLTTLEATHESNDNDNNNDNDNDNNIMISH